MIQIKNGLKEINSLSILSILLLICIILSCEKDRLDNIEISTGQSYHVLINDTLIADVLRYDNGFVKSIITKDKLGVKNGFQLEYHSNGVLKEKYYCKNGAISGGFWKYNDSGDKIYFSNYVDGTKRGNTYEFYNEKFLKSHFLFEGGNAIYLGYYDKGEKQLNSPIPVFQDEKVRNDSIYEARITFPFPFKGNLEIYLQDSISFKKEYVDKYNLNLTITNFNRSWKKYDMLLEYEPAENDSLVLTEQVYNRTIRLE